MAIADWFTAAGAIGTLAATALATRPFWLAWASNRSSKNMGMIAFQVSGQDLFVDASGSPPELEKRLAILLAGADDERTIPIAVKGIRSEEVPKRVTQTTEYDTELHVPPIETSYEIPSPREPLSEEGVEALKWLVSRSSEYEVPPPRPPLRPGIPSQPRSPEGPPTRPPYSHEVALQRTRLTEEDKEAAERLAALSRDYEVPLPRAPRSENDEEVAEQLLARFREAERVWLEANHRRVQALSEVLENQSRRQRQGTSGEAAKIENSGTEDGQADPDA